MAELINIGDEKLLSFWFEPHPDSSDVGEKWKELLLIAFFIALLLYIFQPFGLLFYKGNMLLLSPEFGIVSFVSGLVIEVLLRQVFKIRRDHPS